MVMISVTLVWSPPEMAGVWFGQRTTFGLGNRNGSSVAGIEGKRCPTLTEGLAKKWAPVVGERVHPLFVRGRVCCFVERGQRKPNYYCP